MNYVLNKTVKFSTTDSILMNISTGDVLHLPPLAVFILHMLIKNHGQVVERNAFFDSAWNDFGVELSGNTLNQYISLLRKNFTLLGMENDIILTSPRIGFSLAEVVKINGGRINRIKFSPPQFSTKWLLFAAVFIVLSEMIFLSTTDPGPGTYIPARAGLIGSCEVYSSHNLIKTYGAEAFLIVNDMASRYLPCRSRSTYFFDLNGSLLFQHDGRIFIARCDKNPEKDTFSGCQEILLYTIRNPDGTGQ